MSEFYRYLVDSHCHLNMKDLYDKRDLLIQSAKEAGVLKMQTICTELREFSAIYEITQEYDEVFASVGTHPLNLKNNPIPSSHELVKLSKNDKVIGFGETGLDYHYEKDEDVIQKQKESFIQHIIAAQETGLPIIVHTRDADQDTVAILQEFYNKKRFKGVIHCFTASRWLADECLKIGMYISASGIITFKNADDIRNTFAEIPLDRILVETDSPYLAPVPHRGKMNEPAYVKNVAEKLAEIRDIKYEDVVHNTTQNFLTLFNLV